MASPSLEFDSKTEKHLDQDEIIWLTTVGADGRPHAVPVWFFWDGHSFLIYSTPGQKIRDIERNPHVQLHLNTDRAGSFVARFDGEAEVLADHAPAYRVGKYLAKYKERIRGFGWTPRYFSDQYHVAVRVRPTRMRS